jgi:flagellar basal body-associated protein FliL
MLDFIQRRLRSEKGAMDKILVTLLLVVVGVAAVVGLSSWLSSQEETVKGAAETQITNVVDGNAS